MIYGLYDSKTHRRISIWHQVKGGRFVEEDDIIPRQRTYLKAWMMCHCNDTIEDNVVGINLFDLYDDFCDYVDNMTDEDVRKSISYAELHTIDAEE